MMRFPLLLLPAVISCSPAAPPFPSASAEAAAVPAPATPESMFVAGIEAYAARDLESSREHLEAAVVNLPLVADHAVAHLARIAEGHGEASTALRSWRLILDRYPDSVWQPTAALAMATSAYEERNLGEARRWLQEAQSERLGSAEQASASWLLARVARAEGAVREARRLRDRVRERHRGSPEARAAQELAWAERDAEIRSQRDAEAEIRRWLAELRPDRALELAREARRKFPATRAQAGLTWLEAEALRKTGKADEAEKLLRAIRKRHPRSDEASEALYRLALNAWNRDEDARARDLFEAYARDYPRGRHAAESLYAIARIHATAQRYPEAATGFERMLRAYPRSTLAAESRWRIGWAHYRARSFGAAERAFARASRSSSWKWEGVYWQARAREQGGGDAHSLYERILSEAPDDYHAEMATRRTGRAVRVPTSRPPNPPGGLPPLSEEVHVRRLHLLARLGFRELARMELRAIEGSLKVDERLRTAFELEAFRDALRTAYEESRCEPTHPLSVYCFPRAYWRSVLPETRRHGLDPYLVLALMRQESLFDPRALSPANARGLMQLIPSTAERTARSIGQARFDVAVLFDPDRNIELGVAHFAELSARYEGSVVRMLAAYNAGAHAVAKWDRRFPGAEDDEFVATISYRETRNYVQRVLRHRRIYGSLYASIVPNR